MTQGYNNMSAYQRMLAETDPTLADPYGIANGQVQPKVKPQVIKNQNPTLIRQLQRNMGQTGKAIAGGAKNLGKVGAVAGKATPWLAAATGIYDIARSKQLADQMEQINQIKPGSYPQEAIDFYRNKAKVLAATTGVGTAAGGIAGAGAFSLPGAAVGAGVGNMAGNAGYWLANLGNKYKDLQIKPEDLQLLYGGNGNGKNAEDLLREAAKNKGQAAKGTSGTTGGAAPTQQTAQQIADQLAAAQLLQGQQQGPSREQLNEDLLNQYIAQIQGVNKPYIDSLTNYYKNYDEMLKRNQAYKRYWQGISSITGNPNWAKIADAYNPIVNEANKVGLVKQLQDARSADLNAINEAMGNLAAVREMDMDPETAFANKNLLTMMSANNKRLTDWEKAQLMADVRRYGFDMGYKKALDTQRLRNEGSANVANINAAAYGGGGGYNAPGIGLNPYGGVQQKLQNLYGN